MPRTIDDLVALSPKERLAVLRTFDEETLAAVYQHVENRLRNPYQQWVDDPVGFVTDRLRETLWSKQRQILESLRDNKRTAVPASHAPGKSHVASRAVAWWVSVHPPGTAQVVTTATTFRQVKNILWPHLRRVQSRHDLPGEVFQTEWKVNGDIAAFGFSANHHDETAVQGIHYPHLLVVVDEAGGIPHTLGNALEALMTGGHTRLLLLGNPPTDEEGSWFERACNSDLYNVIPISAYETPNFTGEDAGICRACPVGVAEHPVTEHLVDATWVNDVIQEFGEDSPFVEARVHARFPKQVTDKVMPYAWVEAATENTIPEIGPIRLGVDVASDGGDEFVIAWADGMQVSIRHKSSGSANANAVDVAGTILQHIREAEAIHRERRYSERVVVKIDAIGVGWGVVSTLKKWGDEEMHTAAIIGVNVAERPRNSNKFTNQRAEMWWNGRTLVQPQPDDTQMVRLDIDRRTQAQLSAPKYLSDSSGRIKIESKADIKRRGQSSPDRAEAVLLALYEPPGSVMPLNVAPVSLSKTNDWKFPSM